MPTSGFNLFTSNRLEVLVDKLATDLRSPLSFPLEKELIIVQSQGMARWVAMELARINQICANCFFPFPNAFLNHLSRLIRPDLSESPLFNPQALTFRIMAVLPQQLTLPDYKSLKSYLKNDPDGIKLYQLSSKIANLYDQYLVFRPTLIHNWEKGSEPSESDQFWQADLWRKINPEGTLVHRAHLHDKILSLLSKETDQIPPLPERVAVFGISHLPAFHLQVMAAVAKHTNVNLYVMNPCKEYWVEIVSNRDIRRIKEIYADQDLDSQDLHLDKGNRILSNMGALGRDFMAMVNELNCSQTDMFESPTQESILGTIQTDILDLLEPPTRFDSVSLKDADEHVVPTNEQPDGSISFHACHSPMREIEVLHDQLLAMLDANPDLMPRDILVMIPEIETYAPYIYAVFDGVVDERLRIPFSVADRSVIRESQLIEGFMAILALNDTRLEAGRLMGLLEYPAILEAFDMKKSDLARIETWVNAVNIRWGKDAEARAQLGLPAVSSNTWQFGIQRLLMGLAMSVKSTDLFSGILPFDNLSANGSLLLGKFLEFLEHLFRICEALQKPHSIQQWAQICESVIDRLFSQKDPYQRELQTLRQIIDQMVTDATAACLENEIDVNVIRTYLGECLEKSSSGSNFISGGVTFCAMLPLRSIPFRVVCLVGMNADVFPRDTQKLSFDIMAGYPMKGDRSRRDDDKYLFLEALLSARENLYISYVGQSIQDNTRITPSVLVSELVDYMYDRFGLSPENLIKHHPLQAFSSLYYQKNNAFVSYSRENFNAANQLHVEAKCKRFPPDDIAPPADTWREIDVEMLCQFFGHPTRFLLQNRLGITLKEMAFQLQDRENFRLEPLEKYVLEQELLQFSSREENLEALKPVLEARGILPYGQVGTYEFKVILKEVETFREFLAGFVPKQDSTSRAIEMVFGDFKITGSIPNVHNDYCLYYRYARSNPKDLIRSWIYHLLLGCIEKDSLIKTYYVSRDKVFEFQKHTDSCKVLSSLLAVYWQGLNHPLSFFPYTSLEYAHQVIRNGHDKKVAIKYAANKWVNERTWSESLDPYISLCFKNLNPLDRVFEDLAEVIFKPLLTHTVETQGPQ